MLGNRYSLGRDEVLWLGRSGRGCEDHGKAVPATGYPVSRNRECTDPSQRQWRFRRY